MDQSFVLIVFAAAMAPPAGNLAQSDSRGRAIIYLGRLDDNGAAAPGYSALISSSSPGQQSVPANDAGEVSITRQPLPGPPREDGP